MISQYPVRPSFRRQRSFIFIDHSLDFSGIPGETDQGKIKGKMGPRIVLSIVGDQPVNREVDFPDNYPLFVLVGKAAHHPHDLMDFGLICGIGRN